MKVVSFGPDAAQPIEGYESVGASSVHLADGQGEAHAYCVRFEPGGSIGPHPTGFGQLFLVVAGSGWVAGGDGRRVALATGQAALLERGEMHSKGSEDGMTAIMLQVHDLEPAPPDGQ